ncbi:MAG TPA: tetratricopeptide repeat protein [Thermoleophilaceae bacterium]|nr:tetratricopeptide repeat protein [Thermoleophilaceae bacterium]
MSAEPQADGTVFDVDEADFEQRVVERSRELPVVVDFWADWCGPCKQLTPVLERAATARAGKVELAKVDVDRNRRLQAAFRIQGIPAVKAFRDGRVAAEFAGALPPAEVERFFDALVPSEADELARGGDEASLRRALELDPGHAVARRELGKLLLQRGDTGEAVELLDGASSGDFVADGLLARARLAGDDGLAPAFAAWDSGDVEAALERLQESFAAEPDASRRDLIRRVLVAVFTELGPDSELARQHRRRLSTALY